MNLYNHSNPVRLLTELIQNFIPTREASVFDFIIDALGVKGKTIDMSGGNQ